MSRLAKIGTAGASRCACGLLAVMALAWMPVTEAEGQPAQPDKPIAPMTPAGQSAEQTEPAAQIESIDALIEQALDIANGESGQVGQDEPRLSVESTQRATSSPRQIQRRELQPPRERVLVRFKRPMVPAALLTKSRAVNARRAQAVSCVPGLAILDVRADGVDRAITSLRADPDVLYAEKDLPIHITGPPDDPHFDRLWGMDNQGQPLNGFFCFATGTPGADISAIDAWTVWTGDPDFRIAVIDTGINYLHPDLAANIWTNPGEIPDNGIDDDANGWVDDVHGYDFHNMDADPMDDHRHGSHVAGTIGAAGNNQLGVVGVNHRCSLVALKVFDQFGRGSVSSAVMAMDYVIANGIRLSNNSWGCNSADGDCFSRALRDVIAASQSIDHLFVAAAGNNFGNDNDENAFFPVGYELPNILGVAAINNRDGLALFSNFGATTVDVAAPGTCIFSTVLGEGYGFLDGTSMATPHVTGVAGLVMSRLPGLSASRVKQRIMRTARPVPELASVVATGGVVNARAAVWDCNTNGVRDEDDIAAGTSEDCNANLLPDECEPDCNDNGVADSCDVAAGTSEDCSGNGVPDECEPDCNGNGVADVCDIRDGLSLDCDGETNGNGVPDECEPDCDDNGVADSCDVARGAPDCNRNVIPDHCEVGGTVDCNGNLLVDLCDVFLGRSRDCNNNAVPDECDVDSRTSADCTGNRIPDECEPDCNGNGVADSCDILRGNSEDCAGNRIPDECEPDCNGNGVADGCDIRDGVSADCNENRVPDECEPGGRAQDDCNGNGRPDLCDVFDGIARDCDSNAVLDPCDIDRGNAQDTDGDGLLDRCEGKGFRIIPVWADGPHSINDNEIVLDEAGRLIELEIRISGWDLDGDGQPKLRGYQPEIDASGFTSGLYGSLAPANLPCSTGDDCPIWKPECGEDGFCGEQAAVGIDLTRPDFVFADVVSIWVANFISRAPNIFVLSAVFDRNDAVADEGEEKYAATMLLRMSDVAGGTFTVGLDEKMSLFADDRSRSLTIPSFTPAVVSMPSDCNNNGRLDELDVASGDSADCNDNGIPDECLHIEPDCNANGVPDDCDIAGGQSADCTGDGVPDECDADCNNNGAADSCDIADGISADINRNAVPDECDPRLDVFVDTVHCFFPGSGSADDPYCNLQFAIDSLGSGRDALIRVLVADGVYKGIGNKNIEFAQRALTLESLTGPNRCIIDAEHDGRAFVFRQGDDAISIKGFTIRNASASSGGAVFINGASPTFEDCVFEEGSALRFGGAIQANGGRLKLKHCRFLRNRSEFFNGGAIYSFLGAMELTNCVFTENRADFGGGLYGFSSELRMTNCSFVGNEAARRGGALYVTGAQTDAVAINTLFHDDRAPSGAEIFTTGGSTLSLAYSLVSGLPDTLSGNATVKLLDGVLTGNPRLVDAAAGDVHLRTISPCINSGDPEFESEPEDLDIDGEARIRLGRIDIGADEADRFDDCNGNTEPDGREIALGLARDCNANDRLDSCDIAGGDSPDALPPEGDGIPDECQSDCNENMLPDAAELAGGAADCNRNDRLDECDIADQTSEDCDADGVPDECMIFGDVTHDAVVNVFDVFCVLDAFAANFANCTLQDADIGECRPDGFIDLFDLMAVLDALEGLNLCCPSRPLN